MPDSSPRSARPWISPCSPAPQRLGGDFLRIGRADRRDVPCVVEARLEERHLAVEFHAMHVERAQSGMPRLSRQRAGKHALIGDVVDGHDAGNVGAVPAQIGRRQAARPVMRVQQVGRPAQPAAAAGDLGRRERQARETQMVVGPIAAVRHAVRRAAAVVQRTGARPDRRSARSADAPRRCGSEGYPRVRAAGRSSSPPEAAPAHPRRPASRHARRSRGCRSATGRPADTSPSPPALASPANSLVTNRTFMRDPGGPDRWQGQQNRAMQR